MNFILIQVSDLFCLYVAYTEAALTQHDVNLLSLQLASGKHSMRLCCLSSSAFECCCAGKTFVTNSCTESLCLTI